MTVTNSIIRGLTWEYLRHAWWLSLVSVGGMVGGPLLFLGLISIKLQMGEAGVEFRPLEMHFPFLGMAAVAWGFVVTVPVSTNWRPRVYSLPISTRLLVGWQMTVGLLTAAVLNVVTMVLYRFLLDVTDWPWLGPTLLIMTLVSLKQAFVWQMIVPNTGANKRYVWHCVRMTGLIIAVVTAVIIWVDSRYLPTGRAEQWYVPWELSVGDVLTMVAVNAWAWWMALRAAARHRHNDLADAPEWDEADSHETELAAEPDALPGWLERLRLAPKIRDADHALQCLHWHDGMTLAIVLAVGWGGVMMAALAAMFSRDNTGNVVEGTFVFFTVFPALGGTFIGTILGAQSIGKQAGGPMPSFVGTTPVSDRQLSRSYLMNLLKTVTLFWGLLIIAAAAFAAGNIWRFGIERILQLWQHPDAPVAGVLGSWWLPVFLLFSFLVTWTGAGWTVASMWAGRSWCQMALMSIVILIMMGPAIFLPMFPPELQLPIRDGGLYALAGLITLGTLAAFIRAVRKGVIRPKWAAFAVGGWGVEAAIFCATVPVAAVYQLAWSGIMAATLAPIAIGPLALSWNRHR